MFVEKMKLRGDLKMANKPSITRSFLKNFICVIVVFTVLVDGYIIFKEYRDFDEEVATIKNDHIQQRKLEIKNELERILSYIEYKKYLAEDDAKKDLKEKTEYLYQAITEIYEENATRYSNNQIKELIFKRIKDFEKLNSNCYVNIFNLHGDFLLNSELESGTTSVEESTVIRKIIDKNREEGRPLNSYYWSVMIENRDEKKTKYIKLGYVKLFNEYDWFIGVGEQVNYIGDLTKNEILGWIEKIKFAANQYFFIDNYEGEPIVFNGKPVEYNYKPINNSEFMEKALAAAENGGGYIYYPALKNAGDQNLYEKVSYVKGINDWQWVIGVGVFLKDLEKTLTEKNSVLRENTIFHVIKLIILLVVFIVLIFIIAGFLALRMKRSFSAFISFFDKAALESIKMESEKVHFKEFSILAESVNRMIDKRNEIELALSTSRKRFKDIAESIADCIWEIDTSYRYVYISGKVKKLLGYEPDEMIGKTPFEFSYRGNNLANIKIKKLFKDKFPLNEPLIDDEQWYKNKSDEAVCLLSNGVPIYDEDGVLIGFRGVNRDITEKKLAEMELEKYREHLEELVSERTNELAEKQAQLVQSGKLASLGEMAAGMAHEINQPLSTISYVVKNISAAIDDGKGIDPEFFKKKSDRIIGCVDRISNIINHVRMFSREQKNGKNSDVPFNIIDSIKNAMSLVQQQYINHGINIHTNFCSDIVLSNGDTYRFEQVIINFLSNAKDAIEEKSALDDSYVNKNIFISVSVEEKFIIINVTDNGIGIKEGTEEKILQPFFTTKEAGHGTGLGLSISYGIIKQMKGDIKFMRVEAGGTSVCVVLPAFDYT